MCAAPGSKTAQLIEFLHADESITPTGQFNFFTQDIREYYHILIYLI